MPRRPPPILMDQKLQAGHVVVLLGSRVPLAWRGKFFRVESVDEKHQLQLSVPHVDPSCRTPWTLPPSRDRTRSVREIH